MKRSVTSFLLSVTLLLLASSVIYGQATWYVAPYPTGNDTTGTGSSSSPFHTINTAIGSAAAGDTIRVASGTYTEEVVVTKNGLKLLGAGSGGTRPLIDNKTSPTGAGRGIVISSGVTGVTIDNFRIKASNTTVLGVWSCNSTKISNTESFESSVGVQINHANSISLTNNTIRNNTTGVVLDNVSTSELVSNTINDNSTNGLVLQNASENSLIRNNTVTSNGTGLWLNNSYDNTIWNNTISNNSESGIVLENGSSPNSISYNDINNNAGGVLIDDALSTDGTVIAQNNISGNTEFGIGINEAFSEGVNAQHNWWGHASGPYNASTNTSGLGDAVSDNVVFLFHKSAPITRNASLTGPVVIGSTVYRSLTVALNNVNTGETISVRMAGLYEPEPTVNAANVTIQGTGRNSSYLFIPDGYFTINGDGVIVDGFDLDAGGYIVPETGTFALFSTSEGSIGVLDLEAENITVRNNRIRGGDDGVYVSYSSCTINNNEIFWNQSTGIITYDYPNTITNNLIYQNGEVTQWPDEYSDGPAGVYLYWGGVQITGNVIANNLGNGIFDYDGQNTIRNNTIGLATGSWLLPTPINFEAVAYYWSSKVVNPPNTPGIGVQTKRSRQGSSNLLRTKSGALTKEAKKQLLRLKKEERAKKQANKGHLRIEHRQAREAKIAQLAARRQNERNAGLSRPLAKRASNATSFPRIQTLTTLPGNLFNGAFLYYDENVFSGNTVKDNGATYFFPEDYRATPYPAGVKTGDAKNLISNNTISQNHFAGVVLQDGYYENVVWNNTISGNGVSTEGEGAGVYLVGGEHTSSVSANIITNNKGHGVFVDNSGDGSYDNVIAMNNITGNTVSGLTVDDPEEYDYFVNAQHNWWGHASGPGGEGPGSGQAVSDDVVYLFYKTSPLPLPVTTPGPVVADGNVYRSLSDLIAGDYKLVGDSKVNTTRTISLIEVNIGGFSEPDYLSIEDAGVTLRGAGKDLTYIDLGGYEIDVYADNVTIEGFDLDNLNMLNTENGSTTSLRGSYNNSSDYLIYADEVSNLTIRNNRIRGAEDGYAVYFSSVSNSLVENNEVYWNSQGGVYSYSGSGNTIRNNQIFENSNIDTDGYAGGVVLYSGEEELVTENNIFDNVVHGIWFYGNYGTSVEQNNIFNNGYFGYTSGNFNNPSGISMSGNNYSNTVKDNVIANNYRFGIKLGTYSSSENNTLLNNTVGEAELSLAIKPIDRQAVQPLTRSGLSSRTEAPVVRKTRDGREVDEDGLPVLRKTSPQQKLYEPKEVRVKRHAALRQELRLQAKKESEQRKQEHQMRMSQKRQAASLGPKGQTAVASGQLKKAGGVKPFALPLLSHAMQLSNATRTQSDSLAGNWGHGIKIESDYNLVKGNTVKGNGRAVVEGDAGSQSAGIDINGGFQNILEGNAVRDNYFAGIRLTNNANTTNIIGNTIIGNAVESGNSGAGIFIKNNSSSSVILGNLIQGNNANGVLVTNGNTGTMVQFNAFIGHVEYGVKNLGTDPTYVVDARFNYWGAANGPGGGVQDPATSKSATGSGNNISANVLFDPYVVAAPAAVALTDPPLPSNANTTVTFEQAGITFGFTNTGTGGQIVLALFNASPPTGPFQDPSGGTTFQSLNRFWEILEGEMAGFTSSVTFSYAGLTGVINPSGLRIARRPNFSGTGTPWVLIPVGSTTINTSNQTITVTGITDFSQWTILMTPAAPTVTSVSPSQVFRGTTVQMDIMGSNFNSTTTVNFGTDISVSSLQLLSSQQLRLIVNIPAAAALGSRTVTISNGGPGGGSSTFSFLVLNPSPYVTGISPLSGNRGTSINVTINGGGFIPGLGGTTVDGGSGLTVNSVNVVSGSQLIANISISGSATPGTKTLTVSNGAPGGGAVTASFSVTNPAPTAVSITPSSGTQGQTLTVIIFGTGFFTGTTTVNFGAGITVNSVVVFSSSQLQASITIGGTAAVGARTVTVTNPAPGGGTATLANAFTVNAGGPSSVEVISGIIPTDFELQQNYPNPFNPSTSIRFALPERSTVTLTLYNTLGVEVDVLVNGELEPGMYQYRLTADDLPTGMYIYAFKAQSNVNGTAKAYTAAKKMLLVK
jgi:parallel beta-helix repeat protein